MPSPIRTTLSGRVELGPEEAIVGVQILRSYTTPQEDLSPNCRTCCGHGGRTGRLRHCNHSPHYTGLPCCANVDMLGLSGCQVNGIGEGGHASCCFGSGGHSLSATNISSGTGGSREVHGGHYDLNHLVGCSFHSCHGDCQVKAPRCSGVEATSFMPESGACGYPVFGSPLTAVVSTFRITVASFASGLLPTSPRVGLRRHIVIPPCRAFGIDLEEVAVSSTIDEVRLNFCVFNHLP
ncbi:unnamed protein product [Protopolystoma xenopodis]|uniref:Uncharacterized protein n=1 Tax=Protopolystoma xenopodis TaxID=117903 RepID=A0A3S5A7H5_9PLAT|nr:unnamed protein product [Protopolystoma xenopodis]